MKRRLEMRLLAAAFTLFGFLLLLDVIVKTGVDSSRVLEAQTKRLATMIAGPEKDPDKFFVYRVVMASFLDDEGTVYLCRVSVPDPEVSVEIPGDDPNILDWKDLRGGDVIRLKMVEPTAKKFKLGSWLKPLRVLPR